ncbi:MAG: hypothetical protein EOR33_27060 [Mesorhizobium sp.]|uniref:hypothetical protein n=1 Tax=Mesorhizobium sp. TaxID=1871066 RepID=UPI000FC9CBF6|nr:hypothetical protein [Mesorhizobium sp.]RUV67855.1 hypothetical protein EOA78_28800 [Mesorhizobium sp. M5C.F.Cr.IN.023.01.1.1]RWJ06607.1 MAG: hypothetical protein EOR24_25405 [Mesorhizobium sp.]RWJ09321.1 MAG: hypothetical protein EOR25_34795 [Mesorhizobium sp.]RWJ61313.1 MAG: hypothetical protein EOR33_27060 [Mesorhizobium sp.]RWL01366.1 MAG: hypothetical protein EOR56_34230 [Mesorhizobium sp.]
MGPNAAVAPRLLAEPGTGKYVDSAFITLGRDMKERLCKRVQEHAGPPEALKKRPATQWVKPGVKLRIKHFRGDHSHIRRASLLGFSDESEWAFSASGVFR